jgi:hypothetical protein
MVFPEHFVRRQTVAPDAEKMVFLADTDDEEEESQKQRLANHGSSKTPSSARSLASKFSSTKTRSSRRR